ncbi:MAG: Deoxyuridine 5'-triphosphate nucleotidohydrolase [Candidatus Hecatellales archaeon B24]|nr:MAG: Deoxyuridine 5'-triphosphate nucleotidohydrolase [Candidatus Hecatellales archaeon B24]
MASILSDSEIRKLIESPKPLVSGYIDLERQLQPAGFELTLAEVFSFKGFGSLGFEDKDRKLPAFKPIRLSAEKFTRLPSGAYMVRYNEEVRLPSDLSALIFPRSSLMRSGAILYTAVWDRGRGQGLLNVYNPHGIRLKLNARIGQLVFLRLSRPSRRLYRGIYQREGLA